MYRKTLPLTIAVLLLMPAMALAADATPPGSHLALPTDQVWALLAGALVPAVGYLLNHYAPWCDEKVKAAVQVVVAAIAGGIAQAIAAGDVGLNGATLQFVLTAVAAAFAAHHWFWQPSGISAALKAGTNAQHE